MVARLRLLALVFVAVVSVPVLGHAQQASVMSSAPAAGPRRDVTATAVRQLTQSADSTAMQRARRQNLGKPVAFMFVGAAAIVVGAVIGGDVGKLFMIGGAVTGLIGLYQYLQ